MIKIVKIIIAFFVLLVIAGLIFVSQRPNSEQSKKEDSNGTITDNQLSRKEREEQRIIQTKGEGYQRFSLEKSSPKNIIIQPFQPEYYFIPEEKQHSGGIAVFQIKKDGNVEKIWESDDIITLSVPIVAIRDITGDGKIEILALWQDGKIEGLWIYSWTGSHFKLITPKVQVVSPFSERTEWSIIFGGRDSVTRVKDLDKDGIEEVLFITSKTIYTDPKTYKDTYEHYLKIYKWNGAEYYLWKEEKISEEKRIEYMNDWKPL